MIRLLTMLIFCWIFSAAHSQSYDFQVSSGTYSPLQNANELLVMEYWNGQEWTLPVGFGFELFGTPYDSVVFWEGSFYFSGEEVFLDAFGSTFVDRALVTMDSTNRTQIRYRTDGPLGNRIFRFEVANGGFFSGDADDYASFQIWLYEAMPLLEVHFGPNEVDEEVYLDDGWEGPFVGLANYLDDQFLYLEGPPQAPTAYTEDETTDGLVGTPADGTIYRFFPDSLALAVQPVSSTENRPIVWQGANLLYGDFDPGLYTTWSLVDLTGQTWIANQQPDKLLGGIPIPRLTPGVYLVVLEGPEHRMTHKVWISPDQ